jgi:transposase InsO family protein
MALYESPTKRFGGTKPGRRAEINDQAAAAYQRAQRRFEIARAAAGLTGPYRQRQRQIQQLINVGTLPPGAFPSKETIRRLAAKWSAGQQELSDYWDDDGRSGRPANRFPKELRESLTTAIRTGKSARSATFSLAALANAIGVEPPNYYMVHREYESAGRLLRAAARHGSRAAEIDASAHARVPTRYPHDVWALDELTAPVYTRQWCEVKQRFVSVRSDVVLIVDVCSGAVVGYHVVDPSRRIDENGIRLEEGYDTTDVLAALVSAASPDLAPDSTRAFAGYLPHRLRWDNAQQHKSLAGWIKEDTVIDLDVRRIPKRRAVSNGSAENRVRTMKAMCAGMRGHADEYLPLDRIKSDATANPPGHRTAMAGGTSERVTKTIPIDPAMLMSVEEFRVEFNRIVRDYNFNRPHALYKETPANRYHRSKAPQRVRNGVDLVLALPTRTSLVTTDGIVATADGNTATFYPATDGIMLMVDSTVTYHVDPLLRGVFAVLGNRLHFLESTGSSLESERKAAEIARGKAMLARMASNSGQASAEAEYIVKMGMAALDMAKQDHKEAAAAYRESKVGRAEVVTDSPDPLLPALESVAEADPDDPWITGGTNAFLRPLDSNGEGAAHE